ncbi:MAG: hypothetical protein H8E72_02710 [Candidatus Marinimicrobia bacterium]|nr:hypothetical protein [Candidatus Neomarinimicrobiota bacterium]
MSEETKYILKSYISEVLYPKEKYPRNLFPDLESIVYGVLCTKIKKDPQSDLFSSKLSVKKLQKIVSSFVSLRALLKHNSHDVVLIFRHYIYRYIRYTHGYKDEVDDLNQEVLKAFLTEKIHRIKNNYRRDFKKSENFLSYFTTVLRNTYIEELRKQKKTIIINRTVEVDEINMDKKSNDLLAGFEIRREVVNFGKIISLYYRKWPVLLLGLLLHCKIRIDIDFLDEVFPDLSKKHREILLNDYSDFTIDDIFIKLAPIFDRYESEKILPSSYVKRAQRFEKEIIHKMNMLNRTKIYDKEILSALIEVYMEKYTPKVHSLKLNRGPQK